MSKSHPLPAPLGRRDFVKSVGVAAAATGVRCSGGAGGFASAWSGTRVWIGPEYWANPLQNWRLADGEVIAQAAAGRTLHLLTHQALAAGSLRMEVTVRPPNTAEAAETWAGFVVGIRGSLPGYQNALVHPQTGIRAGLRSDGKLVAGDAVSEASVATGGPVALVLEASEGKLTLSATASSGEAQVETAYEPEALAGNLALAAQAAGRATAATSAAEWGFRDWRVSGSALEHHPEQTFGPILWSQYTLSGGVLKLTALFPPIGEADEFSARLESSDGGRWSQIADAPINRLSRTAIFRVEGWDSTRHQSYRVAYRWGGSDHYWEGSVRRDPGREGPLKIAVFSCDHGECFPQQRMLRNVAAQDPDLVYFAGDQIYESHGGFGVARDKPAPEAMLDYLRKYWQHGWTWREILKDRPSIVIPDDHDVFQGNIWGQGGRALPPATQGLGFENGGFLMPVDWVNAVQRTQAGHLPDPVDPAPCESGIEVYFTELNYGGVSFAILEDRKFKTGPYDVLTEQQRAAGEQNPAVLDVAGAEMLGARQEDWLRRWTQPGADADLRVVCSQTIFCKASTHAGGQLARHRIDLDSGGWPQQARRRALEIFKPVPNLVMLHGDQHVGTLLRYGLDDWEDGSLSFMVPGTSNGFPRAWWPEEAGGNRKPDAPEWTGRFQDGFGHRITVLGVANPEEGSNTPEGQAGLDPEQVAHRKGSGYGVLTLDREAKTLTFDMWRHGFEFGKPAAEDQFPGFPFQTLLDAG